jgi:hypothetical protein
MIATCYSIKQHIQFPSTISIETCSTGAEQGVKGLIHVRCDAGCRSSPEERRRCSSSAPGSPESAQWGLHPPLCRPWREGGRTGGGNGVSGLMIGGGGAPRSLSPRAPRSLLDLRPLRVDGKIVGGPGGYMTGRGCGNGWLALAFDIYFVYWLVVNEASPATECPEKPPFCKSGGKHEKLADQPAGLASPPLHVACS